MMTGRAVFSCLLYRSSPGHLVTGTFLITSAEQLFDDLDLPLNETNDSKVVRTACSKSESPLGGKLSVLPAGKLCIIVTDHFLCVIIMKMMSLVDVVYFIYLFLYLF